VTFGNLLTLPVGGGLLYVQPIYVSANTASAFPLSRVTVAAFGNKLAWSDTLEGALDELFGGDSGAQTGESDGGTPTTPPPTTPENPTPGDPAKLNAALADLQTAFADGEAALEGRRLREVWRRLSRPPAGRPRPGDCAQPRGWPASVTTGGSTTGPLRLAGAPTSDLVARHTAHV
jgi:uncharacterized membrane protein (UPF0182 family)